MEINTAIDIRLRNICNDLNITMSGLALKSGLSPTTLLDIRRVKKIPNLITIKKICDAVGIRLSEFFDSPEIDNIEFIY